MSRSSRGRTALGTLVAIATMACGAAPPLEQLSQARDLSADLLVQFVSAADASNKVIMADTNEAAAAFARDAQSAKQTVQTDITSLKPLLSDLGYAPETDLLRTFASCLDQYRELDAQALALADENTNRRAQRLSFGPALAEADGFRDAVNSLAAGSAANTWQVKALAATAVAAVREMQALQAPHIAEAGDTAMTAMEQRMASAQGTATSALQALAPVVSVTSRSQLDAANAALNRFVSIHTQITELSRRNSNVRSLALSLNEKGKVTRECEDSLRALRDALAARGFKATR